MNYSFEYIDIILLAMIAGFIFLRLRGILGKKTGLEENIGSSFEHDFPVKKKTVNLQNANFDEDAKKEFLSGAKIAYETIITNFSKGNLKDIKSLLGKKIYDQFNDAILDRKEKGHVTETTFIGINSADIKNYVQKNNMFEITVDFVSEIISVKRDKDNNVIEGDPDKIKTVIDKWKFTRPTSSMTPNWYLAEIKNS